MATIFLITGAGRSGKSDYALKTADALPGPRVFIATCPAIDDEMRARIKAHREARRNKGWLTIEETTKLDEALLAAPDCNVALVDCLTLWVNNLLYEAEVGLRNLMEQEIEARCNAVLEACAKRAGVVIFVTNEVGWGIIPADPVTRRFRDLSGRCNSIIARAADEVILMICGLPTHLKKEP